MSLDAWILPYRFRVSSFEIVDYLQVLIRLFDNRWMNGASTCSCRVLLQTLTPWGFDCGQTGGLGLRLVVLSRDYVVVLAENA